MRSVDTDQDGSIDYGEFVARFQVHFDRVIKVPSHNSVSLSFNIHLSV